MPGTQRKIRRTQFLKIKARQHGEWEFSEGVSTHEWAHMEYKCLSFWNAGIWLIDFDWFLKWFFFFFLLHVTPWKWQSHNLAHALQASDPIHIHVQHSTWVWIGSDFHPFHPNCSRGYPNPAEGSEAYYATLVIALGKRISNTWHHLLCWTVMTQKEGAEVVMQARV